MVRWMLPAIAVVLFLVEPTFSMLSPIRMGENALIIVPRFLILFLIFVAVYYNRKRAYIYAALFGLLYDVIYIDVIGLYTGLYVGVCFIAAWCVKFIHQHILIVTILAMLLMSVMEIILYYFYGFTGVTDMSIMEFLLHRLLPTVGANFIYLLLLGWAFKYVIDARLIEIERNIA